jgi:hypothetical protein
MNPEFKIIAKPAIDTVWQTNINKLNVPGRVTFKLEKSEMTCIPVQKIFWDFGDNTKISSISNRKLDVQDREITHNFRSKNITNTINTLSVMASVFTEVGMIITPNFKIQIVSESHKNYVDPTTFKNQIEKYYKDGDMIDELALSVYQIANRLAFAPNFINYTYREEMVGDALIKMYEALTSKKFKSEKGNPFSYFTKIAFHAFCNRIKKEKRMHSTLIAYQEEVYGALESDGVINHQRNNHNNHRDE